MMKPHTLVALGALLGVTASAATAVLTQQNAARGQQPARYQARCVLPTELESHLNQHGAQGWRLVSMVPGECAVKVSHRALPVPRAGFLVVLGR